MTLKKLIEAGLTVRDGYVLEQLTKDESIIMTDLAGGIMAKAHITQIVDKLIRLRLVERHRQGGDRRKVYCRLTEKGQAFTSRDKAYEVQDFIERHDMTVSDFINYVNDMESDS